MNQPMIVYDKCRPDKPSCLTVTIGEHTEEFFYDACEDTYHSVGGSTLKIGMDYISKFSERLVVSETVASEISPGGYPFDDAGEFKRKPFDNPPRG